MAAAAQPADDRVLARISIPVAEGRQDGFAEDYDRHLAPVLRAHGVAPTQEQGRTPAPGWFCRLVEVETIAQVISVGRELEADDRWRAAREQLGVPPPAPGWPAGVLCSYQAPVQPDMPREAGLAARTGPWLRLGVQDGLPAGYVYEMAEAGDGVFFFATSRGLCCFDGGQFSTLGVGDGLPPGEISDCAATPDGQVWATSLAGRLCRIGHGRVTAYDQADGLARGRAFCLLPSNDGCVWIGGEHGLSRWSRGGIRTWGHDDGIPDPGVATVAPAAGGGIWLSCGRAGIARLDGDTFTHYSTADGLSTNWVNGLVEDGDGALWIAGCGGDVTRFDGQSCTHFGFNEGLAHNWLFSLALDPEGRIWAGTQNQGVSVLQDGRFHTHTTGDGLQSNVVRCIFRDSLDRMWLGGFGVTRCDARYVGLLPPPANASKLDVEAAAFEPSGALLAGTRDGLHRWRAGAWRRSWTDLQTVVRSIRPLNDGTAWLGAMYIGGGVLKLAGDEVQRITARQGTFADYVYAVDAAPDGEVWAATREGLRRVIDGAFSAVDIPEHLATACVTCVLAEADGGVWAGTAGLGAAYLADGSCRWVTPADGLPAGQVNAIARDRKGRVWVATAGGVACLTDGEISVFTAADGLSHDEITSVMADRGGHYWFATLGGGVCRFDGTVFQRLTEVDGLPGGTVRQVIEGPDGNYWIACEGGLARYRPSEVRPEAAVRRAITRQRQEGVAEVHATAGETVVLEVTGRSPTTHPSRLAYVYQLRGHQDEAQVSYSRRIEYAGLPEGRYTFSVRAVDRDLNYSDPAEVSLVVGPDPTAEALAHALSVGVDGHSEFVGASQALRDVLAQLIEVARTDLTVLIEGETGTGKGLAARFVHANGDCSAGPFIQVNCGAMPEGLVESELFGHEKGAFTGATSRKLGKAELASGGTLFLDEIGDLSLPAQVKLLRLLEERTFERVGGTETHQTDVRVIAATNRDILAMVSAGRFREDLYYRLEAFPVRLPPLRERRDDVPLLAAYFVERMSAHLNRPSMGLSQAALGALMAYDWPGNIRELEHALQRAVIVARGTEIAASDINVQLGGGAPVEGHLTMAEAERRHILHVMDSVGWRVRGPGGAAELLGLAESTLRSRMKRLGIQRPS